MVCNKIDQIDRCVVMCYGILSTTSRTMDISSSLNGHLSQ
jgi:hypothetical protein